MPSTSGMPNSTSTPQMAIPVSMAAYTISGCFVRAAAMRGSIRLPRHSPPMKVASRTPSEIAVEPMTSCSNWYQTIS